MIITHVRPKSSKPNCCYKVVRLLALSFLSLNAVNLLRQQIYIEQESKLAKYRVIRIDKSTR